MSHATAPRARPRPGRRTGAAPLLACALVLAVAASCAGAGGPAADPPAPSGPDRRPAGELLSAAVGAADSADHSAAARLLEEVRERCGASRAGARAALLLAAVHLDPRHADGEPQVAADRAAEYLRTGVGPAWTGPVARALYLQALENGAEPRDPAGLGVGEEPVSPGPSGRPAADGCRTPGTSRTLPASVVLPELPGTPMAERLGTLRARIAELEKELERIRDVLDEP